jgi:hypothetical protein
MVQEFVQRRLQMLAIGGRAEMLDRIGNAENDRTFDAFPNPLKEIELHAGPSVCGD